MNHFALPQTFSPGERGCRALFVMASCLLAVSLNSGLSAQLAQSATLETTEVSNGDVIAKEKPDQSSAEYILKYQGIETSAKAFKDYLQSLQPDHPRQVQITQEARVLIGELGNDDYRVRRRARENLARMPTLPLSELKAARFSGDAEVRGGAAMILEYADKRAAKDSLHGITKAICQMIVNQEMKGLANELVATVALFEKPETISALQSAIAATATEHDLPMLADLIAGQQVELRIAAIAGLVKVKKEDSTDTLAALMKDADQQVKLRAARELANMGDRRCMLGLTALMESEDFDVRHASHRVLKAVTDKKFDYFAFEKPELRKAALSKWQTWLAAEGVTAKMHFPLVESKIVVGRILLSDYSAGKVIELDLKGEVTWEKEISNPWAVEGLSNGHRLIGLYEQSSIVEFDETGEEVWRVDNVPGNVMGIDRAENGNTLAACSSGDKVVEYDRNGKIVWEKQLTGRPTDAKYLENGNLLVTLMSPHKVLEVTRDGETVWELATDANPLQAQRTNRGTTLIAHNSENAAVEYDRNGEEVARIKSTAGTVTSAREMENGDLMLSTSNTVIRQKRDGTVVWEYKDLTYCYNICPY